MRLNEIFTSVQGEGPLMGGRATFVRLSGCNMACPFCDTKYAWDTYFEVSVRDVVAAVKRAGCNRVVITGGEPTIQLKELLQLTEELRKDGYQVSLETNGVIDEYDERMFDLVVVSPKRLDDWDKWLGRNVIYKFVIDDSNVGAVMSWVSTHGLNNVYFMPEGTTPQSIVRNSKIILEGMEHFGINGFITPRLHLLLGVK